MSLFTASKVSSPTTTTEVTTSTGAVAAPIAAPAAAPQMAGGLTDETRAKGREVAKARAAELKAKTKVIRDQQKVALKVLIDQAKADLKAKYRKPASPDMIAERRKARVEKYGATMLTFFGYVTKLPDDAVAGAADVVACNGDKVLAGLVKSIPGIRITSTAAGWECILKHRDGGTLLALSYSGTALTATPIGAGGPLFDGDCATYLSGLFA